MTKLTDISMLVRESNLKHLSHLEETVFSYHGFNFAYDILTQLDKSLIGEDNEIDTTIKIDGSPSIIFGYHQITRKFFVATKSIFNKKPKINYTPEDIDINHSHPIGLNIKLKEALKFLPHIFKYEQGIYQGDILFGEDDKIVTNKFIEFTPNTITYRVSNNKENYRKINNAKFGIAIHTVYTGIPLSDKCLNGVKMQHNIKYNTLMHSDYVYQSDIRIKTDSLGYYDNDDIIKIQGNLQLAKNLHNKLNTKHLEIINAHSKLLKAYFNYNIRNNKTHNNLSQYYTYCNDKFTNELSKLKRESTRNKNSEIYKNILKEIISFQKQFEYSIAIYHHIQASKDIILRALGDSYHPYTHYINNNLTRAEGYVVHLYDIPIKLVNRNEFSKLNFQRFS